MLHAMVKAADKYSARPGYSEHQTGLTFDIGGVNSDKTYMQVSENKRRAMDCENAHKYGFIVRYPKGKEKLLVINTNHGIYVI